MKIPKNLRKISTAGLMGAILLSSIGASATGLSASAHPRESASVKLKTADSPVCAKAAPKRAKCLAIRHQVKLTPGRGLVRPLAGLAYGATQLRKAYSIRATGSRGKVIAIVDAYHSASAFSDLQDYRSMYGLGKMDNCGVAGSRPTEVRAGKNPCFFQLTQTGEVAPVASTEAAGWAQETALDLEMAAAFCPRCSILLVEAKSSSFKNLEAAVATASEFTGVRSISNSYGGSDVSEDEYPAFAMAAAQGIAVVASSGDSGYGVSSPASFSSVVAVGGTSLYLSGNGSYARETAWSSGGSGCSNLNPPASWQDVSVTECAGKASSDVSAVGDPATGVTVSYEGQWYVYGGTSVSAPIIAALYALRSDFGQSAGEFTAAHSDQLNDVTVGVNGTCRTKLWCSASEGWDGPTGLGSPNGSGAF